jgi:hypothetical protein
MTEYAGLLERLRSMIGDDSSEANIYRQPPTPSNSYRRYTEDGR